jgi:ribonuclease P protein component
MDGRHRLTCTQEFQRVLSAVKSDAHPLVVLVACRNDLDRTRLAVRAGRRLGGAVVRNRARRRLREGMRQLAPAIDPGWDLLLLARDETASAEWKRLQAALVELCRRAG